MGHHSQKYSSERQVIGLTSSLLLWCTERHLSLWLECWLLSYRNSRRISGWHLLLNNLQLITLQLVHSYNT